MHEQWLVVSMVPTQLRANSCLAFHSPTNHLHLTTQACFYLCCFRGWSYSLLCDTCKLSPRAPLNPVPKPDRVLPRFSPSRRIPEQATRDLPTNPKQYISRTTAFQTPITWRRRLRDPSLAPTAMGLKRPATHNSLP